MSTDVDIVVPVLWYLDGSADVDIVASVLWYLDGSREKIMERSKNSSAVKPIPKR